MSLGIGNKREDRGDEDFAEQRNRAISRKRARTGLLF
jgi:hypothetical protein